MKIMRTTISAVPERCRSPVTIHETNTKINRKIAEMK